MIMNFNSCKYVNYINESLQTIVILNGLPEINYTNAHFVVAIRSNRHGKTLITNRQKLQIIKEIHT